MGGVLTRRSTAELALLNLLFVSGIVAHFLPDYLPRDGFEEALTIVLFLAVGVTSILMMSSSIARAGLSTHSLFWFFAVWFFFVAPFTQYLVGDADYAPIRGGHAVYIAIVIVWLALFEFFYKRAPLLSLKEVSQPEQHYEISWTRLVVVATVFAAWVFSYAARYDFLILLIRLPGASAIEGSLPLYLFTNFFARPAIVIAFFLALLKSKQARGQSWLSRTAIGYLFVLALATNSPTSQARFYVFALVVCGLMILIPRIVARAQTVNVFLLFSMIGSSFLHLFRFGRSEYDWRDRFDFAYLHEGHFSSFSNFAHLVDYVNDNGIRWGEQLLGSLLFWMPRSVWPDKPVGTAEFIVREYLQWEHGLVFSNIAMPAVGEFFIDFHVPGVFLGTALLAVVSANIDHAYRKYSAAPLAALPSVLICGFVTGLWLFLNRGDFQSAIAYTAGITAAVLVVVALTCRKPT